MLRHYKLKKNVNFYFKLRCGPPHLSSVDHDIATGHQMRRIFDGSGNRKLERMGSRMFDNVWEREQNNWRSIIPRYKQKQKM